MCKWRRKGAAPAAVFVTGAAGNCCGVGSEGAVDVAAGNGGSSAFIGGAGGVCGGNVAGRSSGSALGLPVGAGGGNCKAPGNGGGGGGSTGRLGALATGTPSRSGFMS